MMKKIIITVAILLPLSFMYAQLASDTNKLFIDSVYNYIGHDSSKIESRIETNIYPIRYHDGLEVLLEFKANVNGIFVAYENLITNEVRELYIEPSILKYTIKELDLVSSYNFWFHEVLADQSIAEQSVPKVIESSFNDVIVLSVDMYQQFEYWTKYEKEMSMRDKLFYFKEIGIEEEILISFTQQFFHETNFSLERETSYEEKINALFDGSKRDGEEVLNGWCDCAYLTHNAIFSPGDYDRVTSENIPAVDFYHSYSPDFHATMFKQEGPAHFKALYMRDKNGGMSYETSTLGVNGGYTMSPSFVKQAYNLVCIGDWETPTCNCTKIIGIDKMYSAQLTAYAPDMNFFWSDGSQAAVEEFATLIVNSAEYGTVVLDAGRGKVRDACETTWNPEWFDNLFALAGDVLGVVINLQTDTSGLDSLTTFADNITQVGQSIVTLASTPFVNETGTCSPVTKAVTLLSGKQFWILKSNQPTDIILASYTYLGSRGYGSWNTTAISESGYSLATVLQSRNGFRQGVNDCCTDRVGHWNAAAITDKPLAENNYINHSESYLGLFGPWNGIQYDVLGNPIFVGNGRYYVYDDLQLKNCAETVPDWEKTDQISYGNTSDISEFEFSLAPNPVNTLLNITINSNNNTNLDVSVYTLLGEKVETVYYGKTRGLYQIQWESKNQELSSGNYFVVVMDEDGNKEVKQFIYKK